MLGTGLALSVQWAERSGVRFPKEGNLFSKAKASRQTVGSTRPSYLMDAGSSFLGRGADHVHVVPRLRMYRTTTLPHFLPSWHEQRLI
jgi:hypothetical protein